ncbi:UDP-GlcNAc:betaGal beta-1,3-N-acetylglucosaminyltransferase-like protein 1 [Ilyodon furcidens]|uniref:UDP-GlcNAc:betaGal beta-1,3-N-acetylglucosaminyltransferase-like protein 1 n=1 Tax=Ilyodon furcidens TaxID=33524 RepID=A0ABV0UI63_9TELE
MKPNPTKRLRTAEEDGNVRETGRGDHGEEERRKTVDVSIIIPVHNASCWLKECLQAILQQDFAGSMELSVFDDASTDDSRKVLEGWRERMEDRGISVVISGHNSSQPRGVGFAKNKAVTQSSGQYLCFQDADDIMFPQRVRLQYETSLRNANCLIGCRVQRLPEGSTERYTRWINSLTQDQLITQVNRHASSMNVCVSCMGERLRVRQLLGQTETGYIRVAHSLYGSVEEEQRVEAVSLLPSEAIKASARETVDTVSGGGGGC